MRGNCRKYAFLTANFGLCVRFCCSCVRNLFYFLNILSYFGLRVGLFFGALVVFLVRFAVFLCVFFVRCAFLVRWRASCAEIVRRAKFWRSCGEKKRTKSRPISANFGRKFPFLERDFDVFSADLGSNSTQARALPTEFPKSARDYAFLARYKYSLHQEGSEKHKRSYREL